MTSILKLARDKQRAQHRNQVCKESQQHTQAMLKQFTETAQHCAECDDEESKREKLSKLHQEHQEFCQKRRPNAPHSI